MNLEIKTYGISTTLYNSSLFNEDNQTLITPIGPSLTKWDIQRMERQKIIQSNTNAIILLLKNAKNIFSIADDGEIAILNHELDIVFSYHELKDQKVRHASVNNNYLSISYKQNEDFSGKTMVYDIQNIYEIKKILDIDGSHNVNQLNHQDNKLLLVKQTILENIDTQKLYNHELLLYNLDNPSKIPEKTKNLELIDDISTYKSNLSDTISLIFLYREIIVVNIQTLEIKYQGTIDGKGSILSAHMKENQLILCPKQNLLLKIKFDAEDLPKLILQTKNDNQAIQSLEYNSIAFSDKNNFIHLYENENQLLSINSGEGSICKIDLIKNITQVANFSKLSLCGLACNQDATLIASGDLGGQIYIFENNQLMTHKPLYQQSILYPSMVRSLAWSPLNNSLLVGDFSGNIYQWEFEDDNKIKQVYKMSRTVTSLKFYEKTIQDYAFLLASSTQGLYTILQIDKKGQVTMYLDEYLGHKPVQGFDVKFGSLQQYAEIWSVAWNPCNPQQFATCSEDQTTSIWNIHDGIPSQHAHLQGHTMAVTSLDWQEMHPQLGQIFVTCSDDRIVKIYKVNDSTFTLIDEFDTTFKIDKKHTLTYLALEKNGTKLFVGSITGILYIYELLQKQIIFSKRLHLGGIEGLIFQNGKLITCSSDNCLNIIDFNQQYKQKL